MLPVVILADQGAALPFEAGAYPRLVAGFADKTRHNALRNYHAPGDKGGAPNG